MSTPEKKPIESGIIARAIGAVSQTVKDARDAWFGPWQPLQPVTTDQQKESVVGRQFDYPTGFNTRVTPRSEEALTFAQLRALAESNDVLRSVIETRKDQMCRLKWKIMPFDKDTDPDERCQQIEAFLRLPDHEHDWQTWLRMLLEDLFVIDAVTIYPRKTLGGELYALEPIDGATIKRVLDAGGRTPLPPDPAYQQVLKGVVAMNYTRDELMYSPRNVRTHKVYGYSHVEQIVTIINIAIRRAIHQLQYYSEGNIPEALLGVPETWTPEQIDKFQKYWDSMIEGNTAARRHAKFVPGSIAKGAVFTKEAALKDEFDDWIARVICFCFSISPQPFVKEQNRATADTAKESASEEGSEPIKLWVMSLINRIIVACFGYTDIGFVWEEETTPSPKDQADIDIGLVGAKILHPDEARAARGLPPLTESQKADMKPAIPDIFGGDNTDGNADGNNDGKQPPGNKKPDGSEDDAAKLLKKKSNRYRAIGKSYAQRAPYISAHSNASSKRKRHL